VTADLPDTLRGFLTSVEEYHQKTPHLAAFNELSTAKDHDRVLSSQAAELWQTVLRNAPEDPLALHHTAIIRHGTGYRLHLEGGASALQAIDQWKQGVQAWAKLVKNDGFWDGLRQKWEERQSQPKGDMIAERLLTVDLPVFRRQLPKHLLALHANLAEDLAKTNPDLAAGHVKVILESGFSPSEVDWARQRVYRSLVKDVEILCKESQSDEAMERVKGYLRIDPDSAVGMADGLRVCKLEADRRSMNASEDSVLDRLFQGAKAWADHPALAHAGRNEVTLAAARSDFYTAWTRCLYQQARRARDEKDITRALRLVEEAFSRAQAAVRCERRGPTALEWYHNVCVLGAFTDLNNDGKSRGLRVSNRMIDAGLELEPNDPELHALRAYYHLIDGDEAACRRELTVAENLNRKSPNEEATGLISQLRGVIDENASFGRIKALIDSAVSAAKRNSFQEALRMMNEAEAIDASLIVIHIYKAQFHKLLGDPFSARASLRRAEGLSHDASPDVREQIADLKRSIG